MSLECSLCRSIHSNGRVYRGLYICRKTKRRINVDLNAASNIARRLGYKVEIRKIESYIATHSRLKTHNPAEGVTPKTPAVKTSPSRAGRGSVYKPSIVSMLLYNREFLLHPLLLLLGYS